jgi:gliding motility-associated-like protein
LKKIIASTAFFFLQGLSVFSQNLVINGSFEEYTLCPTGPGQIHRAIGWFAMNGQGGSSEYLNACATPGIVQSCWVPQNWWGYQYANTGEAYAGMCFFQRLVEYCEYISGTLSEPLQAGKCYNARFYVNLTSISSFAIDAIGMYFTTDSLLFQLTPIEVQPQIENDSGNIISDTANWVKISGSFIASGGEKFFTLGRFKKNAYVNYDTMFLAEGIAYYFIDDVAVWPCDAPVYTANGGGNRQVCNAGDVVTLGTDNLPEYDYYWFDADSNLIDTTATITVAPAEDCFYYLMVRDFKYDITWDTVRITMGCEGSLYVPNIFSPNGDGNNDVLYVRGQNLKELSFAVYNRWGQLVFESKDINLGWDGTHKQSKCESGVYFYYVEAMDEDGNTLRKKGNVSLIR